MKKFNVSGIRSIAVFKNAPFDGPNEYFYHEATTGYVDIPEDVEFEQYQYDLYVASLNLDDAE